MIVKHKLLTSRQKETCLVEHSNNSSTAVILIISLAYIFELKNAAGDLVFTFDTSIVLLTLLIAVSLWFSFISCIKVNKSMIVLLLLWILLFFIAVSSGLWSDYPDLVLKRSLLIFTPSILITILVLIDREPRKTFYKLMAFLAWFGFCLALYGLVIRFTGYFISYNNACINQVTLGPLILGQKVYGGSPLWRISSLNGNPNSLALVLLVSIWSTYIQFKTARMKRLRYFMFMYIQVLALILTFSRTGIGAVVLMCVLFYYFSGKRSMTKIASTCAIICLVSLFLFILMPLLPQSVISALQYRVDIGLNARERAWQPILINIMNKPIGGVGFAVIDEAVLIPSQWKIGAHNVHLTVLSEIGLPGYTILMILWFYGIALGLYLGLKKISNSDDRLIVISAGVLLACLLFHQFFEDSLMRICALHFLWVYLIAIIAVFTGKKYKTGKAG